MWVMMVQHKTSDQYLTSGKVQVTPAMSTSRSLILSLMSKWFFIPNIFSQCIFAFQLCLCRKRLTWSNRYLEVILHALDIFSIIFAISYVEVKNRCSNGRGIVCFGYVHVLPVVRKSSRQKSKTIKVIYLLSTEQGRVTPRSIVRSGRNSNSSEI